MLKNALTLTTAMCSVFVCLQLARPAHAEESGETCYAYDAAGNCIDKPEVPNTGQFTDLDHFGGTPPSGDLAVPEDINSYQHHGNVRITEKTAIFAHNICRIVDNTRTHGKAIYIGLGTSANGFHEKNTDARGRSQWVSFIQSNLDGSGDVDIVPCCIPVAMNACGQTYQVTDYVPVGTVREFSLNSETWGYHLKLTCQNDINGVKPTSPISASEAEAHRNEPGTSWDKIESGYCENPNPGGNGQGNGNDSGNDGNGGGGGQQSHDTNGDGSTDSPGSGTGGQTTKDGPVEKGLDGGGSTGDSGGGGGDGGSERVICTYFKNKGLIPYEWWRADLRFSFLHISRETVRGYHTWSVPYVELMRRGGIAGTVAEKIMFPIAYHRAEELAYQMGVKGAKPNWKGKLVRTIMEPICWAIGQFAAEQDWQRLYRKPKAAVAA